MIQAQEDKEFNQSKLKQIWFFLKPYQLHLLALVGLSLVIGILETASVAAVYPIVSSGLNVEPGQDNILLTVLHAVAAALPLPDIFISYCILFILLVLVIFLVKVLNSYYAAMVSSKVMMQSKERIFQGQIKADYQHFLDHKQGDLIYTTTMAPDRGVLNLMIGTTKLISETVLMLSIIILLFSIFWQGTLLVLVLGAGYYLVTQYLGNRISYVSGKMATEASTEEHVILNEVFNGIKQIKVFLTQPTWVENFKIVLRQYRHHHRKSTVWNEIPAFGIWALAFASIGIIGIILRIQVPGGLTAWLPLFGTFVFAFFRLLGPISNFGAIRMRIMTSLPNVEMVYSAINKHFDNIKDGMKQLDRFTSGIQLDHVSFAHKGRPGTLHDISITFEKGKTTAIVGPSGAGKTTVIDLLLRLFDPDKGEVKVDGTNLKEYALASWLRKIGFVSQDTFTFHDSVKNNITFGANGYSEADIIQAARNANAHEFILEFPQGYDTIVGEQGMKLSGGQKQRIAIARAIVKKPEILILDEATSALDTVSESLVQEAIDRISAERTVIIIAHRLSTIMNADKIVVLKDGRAEEEGTHRELMSREGTYRSLYQGQEST